MLTTVGNLELMSESCRCVVTSLYRLVLRSPDVRALTLNYRCQVMLYRCRTIFESSALLTGLLQAISQMWQCFSFESAIWSGQVETDGGPQKPCLTLQVRLVYICQNGTSTLRILRPLFSLVWWSDSPTRNPVFAVFILNLYIYDLHCLGRVEEDPHRVH